MNMPVVMESIFNLMMSFAKDKMKQRMHVRKSVQGVWFPIYNWVNTGSR